jgi:hypothetical protein
MTRSLSPRFVFGSLVFLASAGSLFAQDDNLRAPVAALGGMLVFLLIFCAAMYIYVALALKTIAEKNPHGKLLARLDPHRQRDFDVEYCQEADLVDHSVFHSIREHRGCRSDLDGRCGGAPKAQLVGHSGGYRSGHQSRGHRLPRLGRLTGLLLPQFRVIAGLHRLQRKSVSLRGRNGCPALGF